jgi:hypothetical protein
MLAGSAFSRNRPLQLPNPSSQICRRRRARWAWIVVVNARTDSDLETAFAAFSQQRVGAFLVAPGTFYLRRMEQLAVLTARHALPAMFPYREFALAGGLLWHQPRLYVPPTWHLYRAHSKRRETSRSAGAADREN